jgi:hypothetical protein
LMSRITSERDKLLEAAQRVTKFWWFEKIWNVIYGSQIAILEHLESQPEGSVHWIDLYIRFYQRAVAVIPMPLFPQYMGFLGYLAQFVAWDTTVDPQNPPVTLQPLGREFLQYIRTQGYAKEMRIN